MPRHSWLVAVQTCSAKLEDGVSSHWVVHGDIMWAGELFVSAWRTGSPGCSKYTWSVRVLRRLVKQAQYLLHRMQRRSWLGAMQTVLLSYQGS